MHEDFVPQLNAATNWQTQLLNATDIISNNSIILGKIKYNNKK